MTVQKVLIIEDDMFYSNILEKKFTAAGYDVSVASDGKQGLEQARVLHPDVILLDMVMPVKNGSQTLQELREDDTLKKTKVIMLSNMQEDNPGHELDYSVSGHIEKANMSLEQVLDKVQEVLSE